MKGRKLPAKFFKGYMTLGSTEETAKGKGTCEYFDFQGEGTAWVGMMCEVGMKFMPDHLETGHSFS